MDEKTWFYAIVESQIPTVTVPPRALTQSSWHKNIFELCYTLIMITYFYKNKIIGNKILDKYYFTFSWNLLKRILIYSGVKLK